MDVIEPVFGPPLLWWLWIHSCLKKVVWYIKSCVAKLSLLVCYYAMKKRIQQQVTIVNKIDPDRAI